MATGNSYELRVEDVDLTQDDGTIDDTGHVNDAAQGAVKPNVIISSSFCDLLDCPVCLNVMRPPIYQCSNGHTLCSGCKPFVRNRCPTCTHELGDIRCLALESIAALLEVPCQYQSSGCVGVYPYYSKLDHESQCIFRPYSCPYSGRVCNIVGDIPYLVSHLEADHMADLQNDNRFNHRYVGSNSLEADNASWPPTVFSCFGQYFCLHFESFQLGMAPFYMAYMRFMGDYTEAKKYSYSLEVEGNGKQMTWQGQPRSIMDSHHKVRDSFDGLIIQGNMALFFSGGDEKELLLHVTGRIWEGNMFIDSPYR